MLSGCLGPRRGRARGQLRHRPGQPGGRQPTTRISFTGSSLAITPATLTVTADAQTKVYGAADPALTYAGHRLPVH